MMQQFLSLLFSLYLFTATAQADFTIRQAFDFNVGDELQYGFSSGLAGEAYTVLDKTLRNDTLFYRLDYKSFWGTPTNSSVPPYVNYEYRYDTVGWSFSNLDSSVKSLNPYYRSHPDTLVTDFCDSATIGYLYDSGLSGGELCRVSKGFGIVRRSSSDGSGNFTARYLRYFKSNVHQCGGKDFRFLDEQELSAIPLDLQIFPQPFENELRIEGVENADYQIFIFDLSGKQLLKQQFRSKTVLTVAHLPQGLFLLKILGEEKTFKRLVMHR